MDTDTRDQIIEYLKQAADAGEVIPLTYYGGTHPGTTREVVPTNIFKTRFHGIHVDTGIEKTYLYEKCYFPSLFGSQSCNELVTPAPISSFSPSGFAESSKRFSKITKDAVDDKKENDDAYGFRNEFKVENVRGDTKPVLQQSVFNSSTKEKKPSISQRGWFIFLWFVFCFPAGITLTLVNPNYSKKKKFIIVFLFVIFVCLLSSIS